MAGTAREQIVEALRLDPDYNDADEYPFADVVAHVKTRTMHCATSRRARTAQRSRDDTRRDRRRGEQLVADARDPKRDEAYLYRVADTLGIEREQMTGSYGIRQIEQAIRERDTFRDQLDNALVPLVKRARKLRPEDVLYDIESGRSWTVKRVQPDAFGVTLDVLAHSTGALVEGYRVEHPDEPMTVLTPLVKREKLLLLRKELRVQLVDYDPDAPEPTGEAS
jgi:hypothetical protein